MIFRRIKAHVEKENWFAVFIDFAIVVIGVFIGIQVANWNTVQKEREANLVYLNRIADDLQTDTMHFKRLMDDWEIMIRDGPFIERFFEGDLIEGESEWDSLLRLFFYAGWLPFSTDDSTYSELLASGRFAHVGDIHIREEVNNYYDLMEENSAFYEFTPPLREAIRGKFDVQTQNYIWTRCFSEETYRTDGDGEVKCPIPDFLDSTDGIASALRSDPDIVQTFRYTHSMRLITLATAQVDLQRSEDLNALIREATK